MLAASSLGLGNVVSILAIAGVIGGAGAALLSAGSRGLKQDLKDRVEVLESNLTDARERIVTLESENKMLTEKVTQAAAVDHLAEVLDRMHDENRADHAELAVLFGKTKR